MQFNPDGSIKLPGHMAAKVEQNQNKLKTQACVKIKREVLSFDAPKRCSLQFTVSEKVSDIRFIDNIFKFFKEKAKTPMSLKKENNKQFEIIVGTDFKRCSECTALRQQYQDFFDGNIINDKGNCTYERVQRDFCYEDYFE